LTANGQRDSHAVTLADGRANGSPRAGQPYRRISWGQIEYFVEHPSHQTKDRARLAIFSHYADSDGRTHEIQRQRGVYGGLAVDIDTGSPTLEQVVGAVRSALGEVEALIYSSSSARPDAMKWRVLFPLAGPLAGGDYADTQTALFGLLGEQGLTCDPTLSRAAQPVFLPNVPPEKRGADGRPLFYRWERLVGSRLDLTGDNRIVAAREALRQAREEEERLAAERAQKHREQKLAHVAATGDTFDPIEHFKAHHSVESLLSRYGFTRSPKGRGSHWKSPLSQSGSYSTEDRGDHWVTVSAWAHSHNVGRTSRNGHRYGDAFDLYAYFEHRGDRSAAVGAYAREVRPTTVFCAGANKQVPRKTGEPALRVEPLEPVGELVPIDQYRRDLVQAVAGAILEGSPGVKLLRGAPGTGKTHAVSAAVARFARGVVSVPSHELAGEVVERLREAGADAVAYPKLDETSCGNFAVASRARAAGLSAAATVCPKCPLSKECRESGYLAGVKAAEAAPHRVVTHARLARSSRGLLEKADYVVLEEDPTVALRPTLTADRRDLERIGDLADQFPEAQRRHWILEGAASIGDLEPVEEFAAWAPEERGARSDQTYRTTDSDPICPVDVTNETPRRRTDRRYPKSFFGELCRVADELSDAIVDAVFDESPPPIRELHIRPAKMLPKKPESEIWRALEMIDRVDPDGIAGLSGEAMRLVLRVALGGAGVYVQTETDSRTAYAGKRTVEVVSIASHQLPTDRIPVFVNDGTIDADQLAKLFGRSVEDITPEGAAPLLHDSRQYACDVLPTTSTAKVCRMLTGIARANPDRDRLGVILHQRHYRELLEADDSPLPTDVRSRIVWSTYWGSGSDRGTNGLHAVADLGIVIGTHRPPPSEIRRTLLRWGDLDAATSAGEWGRVDRLGVGPDGQEVVYTGRGYGEERWAQAADASTRATVRQGVGRGRGICSDGVPIVAVTTEATGLPVVAGDLLPTADLRLDEVVAAVARALSEAPEGVAGEGQNGVEEPPEYRAENPIYILGKSARYFAGHSVALDEVAKRLPGVSQRSVQVWLSDAVEAGLVERVGSARATRYTLPVAVAQAEPLEVKKFSRLNLLTVERPAVEVAKSVSQLTDLPVEPTLPPVVVEIAPSTSPTVRVATVERAPVLTVGPSPTRAPAAPPWLSRVVAPDEHPDELLALRFLMDGPFAQRVGLETCWAQEVTSPLVLKLHRVAVDEAKRRGQAPPPVELVAGHTASWFAVSVAG
jgi:hypothetical protein